MHSSLHPQSRNSVQQPSNESENSNNCGIDDEIKFFLLAVDVKVEYIVDSERLETMH